MGLLDNNMIRSKTIGTILVSLILGVVTFFIATPKKILKNREKQVSEPFDDKSSAKEDLFI
jgi:hypothetical protein